jgi:CheY-like chemotaxis protein
VARVFLVDDDLGSREIFAAILRGSGHSVETAESGVAALRVLSGEVHDVLVIDLKLPDILGGQGKTGHSSTLQNRPFPVSGIEASEFYRTLSPDCKSVWTFVRQLRGPHFSTCA